MKKLLLTITIILLGVSESYATCDADCQKQILDCQMNCNTDKSTCLSNGDDAKKCTNENVTCISQCYQPKGNGE